MRYLIYILFFFSLNLNAQTYPTQQSNTVLYSNYNVPTQSIQYIIKK